MEQDKYYTPSIEEFHVGFECESNYILFNNTVKAYFHNEDPNIFVPVIFTEDNIGWALDSYINDAYPTEFRVKYLDKEDIESLGWEHEKETEIGVLHFKKIEKWYVDNPRPEGPEYYDYIYLDYNPEDHSLFIHNGESYDDHQCWFDGFVKNKTELKWVLNNIDNE